MATSVIDYHQLILDAFRGMVRRVLTRVAKEGLPGEHHFFMTLRVDHPAVVIPGWLRQQHPEELRIVLQHRFEDLEVGEEAFSVTLWFGGVPCHLTVPWTAITVFHDPSVPFGIDLSPATSRASDPAQGTPSHTPTPAPKTSSPPDTAPNTGGEGNVLTFDRRRPE